MRKLRRPSFSHSILFFLLSYSSLGICENGDSFGLRLVVIDSECPFSQWVIKDRVTPLFTQSGFDPKEESISLNIFVNCKKVEGGYVFDSRMHIGLKLSTGPVVYYESPTFGGLYPLDAAAMTESEFLEETEETVVIALDYVKQNWEEIQFDFNEAN